MTAAEWRWAALVGGGVMLATLVPYLLAWGLTPPGHHYQWHLYNPDEPNVYLAWIRQAAAGQWLLYDPYTTEPQDASFLNLFLLALGRVVSVTGLPAQFVYHATRLLAGTGLLVAVYWLAALLSPKVRVRRLAVVLTATASGLGWAAPALNAALTPLGLPTLRPPDFGRELCMPEAITFLSLYLYPLFSLSVAVLVTAVGAYVRGEQCGQMRWALLAGTLGLVLGNIHTYDLFPLYLTIVLWGLHNLAHRRGHPGQVLGRGTVVVLCSAPSAVYQYWTFQQNEVFRTKALTVTATPPLWDLAAAYGLLLPLALGGAFLVWRLRRHDALVAVCWCAATAVCLFLPVSFQRKMIEGVHVPLCLLSALFLAEWLPVRFGRRAPPAGRARRNRRVWTVAVLLLAPSNLAFVAMTLQLAMYNNRGFAEDDFSRFQVCQPPYYLNDGDLELLAWLADNARPEEAVFCTPYLGSYVPALAGNKVYLGHWAETLHFADKVRQVSRFYSGQMSPDEALALLRGASVKWVCDGTYERMVSGGAPPVYSFLQPVHSTAEGLVLYRVAQP